MDDAPIQKEVLSDPRPRSSKGNIEERKETAPSIEEQPAEETPEPEANKVDYLQLMKDEEDEEKKLELYLRYQQQLLVQSMPQVKKSKFSDTLAAPGSNRAGK